METLEYTDLAQIFSSLGGETRIQLLQSLRTKALNCPDPTTCDLSERCCDVSELAEVLGMAISTVSYHLRELRLAGLIQTQRRGKHVYCSINGATTDQLIRFFESLGQNTQNKKEKTK